MKEAWDRLSNAAQKLNNATDEFNRAINLIDQSLKKLNLGVEAFIKIKPCNLGYGRKFGKWGLYLERGSDVWLFNDAPRMLRLEASEFIPELLWTLNNEAEKMLTQLNSAVETGENVAKALDEAIKVKNETTSD